MQSEEQVGITCFVHANLPGFNGILKQRYNDFLVNEITEEGQVLHLTSTALPDVEAPTPPPAPQSLTSLLQRTAALLGQPQADELDTWLQDAKDDTAPAKGSKRGRAGKTKALQKQLFLGPVSGSKDDRTVRHGATSSMDDNHRSRQAVHMLFKGTFEHNVRFETTTVHLDGASAPAAVQPHSNGNAAGAGDGNADTQTAPQQPTGQTPGTYVRVQLLQAGTKRPRDDRAQDWPGGQSHRHLAFVLLKINMDTSFTVNRLARFLGVKPGAVCTAGNKDKRAVTVQRVSCHRVTAARVAAAAARINGVQCGNFSYAERAVALGALQGNQFQIVIRDVQDASDVEVGAALKGLTLFVNYYGLQRFGNEDMPTHRVGAAILRGDWQGACSMLLAPRPRDNEEVVHARAAYSRGDMGAALRLMPRECVAERAVLEGLKRNGATAWKAALLNIPRNLRTLYSHAYQSYLWNCAASHRVATYGVDRAVAGDLVLPPKGGVGETGVLDRSTARLGAVHVVTQEEADAGVYSIRDVVLPLPGTRVQYPSHDTAAVYGTIAAQDGVDLQGPAGSDGHLSNAGGDYRHVVQAPQSMAYEVFRYDDADAELASNDWEVLEHGRTHEDVLEAARRQGGALLGLRLRFQLPTSCYATMLLRELMKTSTAVDVHILRTKEAAAQRGAVECDPEFSD